jgi:triacylglycerol lipase
MTRKPTVVLLHGLARSRNSLSGLRKHLERAGFPTWAHSYPSRRRGIADAAREVTELIVRELAWRELCAVTHSLGGIVVRHMHDPRLAWRRIVMLAPPNQGSQVAGTFGANPLYKWFYGPAGQELADPTAWPAPPAPFAVIAGTHGDALSNPPAWVVRRARIFARGITHDGTVAVDETRLDGMAAFATVHSTHTWIMNHPVARAQVVQFLESGRFA